MGRAGGSPLHVILMTANLSPDEILKAEFDYIAHTVFQANEDRSRATSFYLLTFSSFIAAIISYQLDQKLSGSWVDWGFAVLFLILASMGLLTVLQLARLRMAWYESVQALNQIKEYYIAQNNEITAAFAWRGTSAKKFKTNSVGFMLVIQVALLGGAALGTAAFFTIRAIQSESWFIPCLLVGLVFFLWQLDIYRSKLK